MRFSHLTIKGGVRPPGGKGIVSHFKAPEHDIRADGQWVLVSKGDDAIAIPVGGCVVGVVSHPAMVDVSDAAPGAFAADDYMFRHGDASTPGEGAMPPGPLRCPWCFAVGRHEESCPDYKGYTRPPGIVSQAARDAFAETMASGSEGAMPPGSSPTVWECMRCGMLNGQHAPDCKPPRASARQGERACIICAEPMPKGKPATQKTCGRSCAAKWRNAERKKG